MTVSAVEYQGSQVQVHLLAEGAAADEAIDVDSTDRGAWIAVFSDGVFHASPLQPGQRVGMRWAAAEAHALAPRGDRPVALQLFCKKASGAEMICPTHLP